MPYLTCFFNFLSSLQLVFISALCPHSFISSVLPVLLPHANTVCCLVKFCIPFFRISCSLYFCLLEQLYLPKPVFFPSFSWKEKDNKHINIKHSKLLFHRNPLHKLVQFLPWPYMSLFKNFAGINEILHLSSLLWGTMNLHRAIAKIQDIKHGMGHLTFCWPA